jgi:hypothetical protein
VSRGRLGPATVTGGNTIKVDEKRPNRMWGRGLNSVGLGQGSLMGFVNGRILSVLHGDFLST